MAHTIFTKYPLFSLLTLIGMRGDTFISLSFWIRFCQLILHQNIPNVLKVKIDINRVILTPCPAYWVFWMLPLVGAKDEHFSFFQRSCQLRLKSQFKSNSQSAMRHLVNYERLFQIWINVHIPNWISVELVNSATKSIWLSTLINLGLTPRHLHRAAVLSCLCGGGGESGGGWLWLSDWLAEFWLHGTYWARATKNVKKPLESNVWVL